MDVKLPLKRVAIEDRDFFAPPGGGSPRKVFGDVTSEVRERRASEVKTVRAYFKPAFDAAPKAAAVARVVLKSEALAKTHRPTRLFEGASCPIIGINAIGELLVSVRSETLPLLERRFLADDTHRGTADVSTIETIAPFAVPALSPAQLKRIRVGANEGALKLKVFRHHQLDVDELIEADLFSRLANTGVKCTRLDYARSMSVFRLAKVTQDSLASLQRWFGTQSLEPFPEYKIVRPATYPISKLAATDLPEPDPRIDYPVVGLIDSGVDPANPHIRPWIIDTEEFVSLADRDYEHGTFAAGLLANARNLNHGDARFPDAPCKILDVVAIPKSRSISEDELVAILREVVPKHPGVRIWNISLAGDDPCGDHSFSDMAVAMDEIQTDRDVMFVLPAGNSKTLRDWPPPPDFGEVDRICSPADSSRAITVGSVAHLDTPASRVRAGQPSPFSRRGPGPVYLPKPEVAHFGGNCDSRGQHAQMGVLSIDASGNLAESIGTSFSCPITSALVAHVQFRPAKPLSLLMAKALLVHSAVLSEHSKADQEFRYRGFGIPQDIEAILGCDPWQMSWLFETEMQAGIDLQRLPLPLPACLQSSHHGLRGELTATLLYAPPLDATFGAEYCRTNLELSLGTYLPTEPGTREHKRQVNPFPKHAKHVKLEKALLEQGFKWSPVKVYRRSMPRGVQGDVWRLALMATDRSGVTSQPVRAAVVVTVADPERRAPVYNDCVAAMNKLGWAINDITMRPRLRPRRT